MKIKRWKYLEGFDCPRCCDSVLVHNELEGQECWDGDSVKCCECSEEGSISLDETSFYISWPYGDLTIREYERYKYSLSWWINLKSDELYVIQDVNQIYWNEMFEAFTA